MANEKPGFRVRIDRGKCIGSGNCVFHAPGAFGQDKEGISVVVDLTAQPAKVIEFAVSSCPVAALEIVSESSES